MILLADHFEVRSWDNFIFWARYLLGKNVLHKDKPDSLKRYSLYGQVCDYKGKFRPGHFLYLHYSPYDLHPATKGSENWKFKKRISQVRSHK